MTKNVRFGRNMSILFKFILFFSLNSYANKIESLIKEFDSGNTRFCFVPYKERCVKSFRSPAKFRVSRRIYSAISTRTKIVNDHFDSPIVVFQASQSFIEYRRLTDRVV